MPRQPAFTPEEIAAVTLAWDQFPRRDFVLFFVTQHTGLRISEALHITVSDVTNRADVRAHLVVSRHNLKHGRGAYRRSIQSRVLPLHPPLRSVLSAYFSEGNVGRGDLRPPLFMSRKGDYVSTLVITDVVSGWTECVPGIGEGARADCRITISKMPTPNSSCSTETSHSTRQRRLPAILRQ